jgi:hypothetical protein
MHKPARAKRLNKMVQHTVTRVEEQTPNHDGGGRWRHKMSSKK